jgi:hypothetical protein
MSTVKKVYNLLPQNRFKLDPKFVAKYVDKQPNWGYGILSYVTFKRTYARPVTKEQMSPEEAKAFAQASTQTSEEYWQTCVRCVEGTSSILKQHVTSQGLPWSDEDEQKHAQEMFKALWDFKFSLPGRGLFAMGTEAMEIKGSAMLQNCGMISTANIAEDFAEPFCVLMDFSMCGVGMGFDTRGAGQVTLQAPVTSSDVHIVPDTREGWVDAVRRTLNAFVGRETLPKAWDFSQIRPEGVPLKTFGGTSSGYKPLENLLNKLVELCSDYVGKSISSTLIVDIMNVIGVCVVAGNVRRSSEIALGDSNDEAFRKLKDYSSLAPLSAEVERTLREALTPEQVKELDEARKCLSNLANDALNEEAIKAAVRARARIAELEKEAMQNEAYQNARRAFSSHPVISHRWASNNSVFCTVGKTDYTSLAKQTVTNGEPGYAWLETMRKYGRLADPPNWRDVDAIGCNPCGEQTLHNYELCCLVETYPTHHNSLSEYLATLKIAYRYAKAVTLVPTHNAKTNAVMVRNRRIGISMAGIFEMYCRLGLTECIRWWDNGYRLLRYWDRTYSQWLGVNESIKITTVKPGGTVPLLAGVEGGMKAPTARYYYRTIRIDYKSPLVEALREAGYRIEPDISAPRTVVVYFPCAVASDVRLASEVSLWEQAAIFTALQRHWSDNMVSVTLTFQPHEVADVERVLRAYEGQWKTVSFLPLSTHGYAQAPYIPCSENEYKAAVAQLKPVSLEGQEIQHDQEERYCSGDVCELTSRSEA